MSSVVGLLVLPGASCERWEGCDVEQGENDGWRKMLFVLALLVSLVLFGYGSVYVAEESLLVEGPIRTLQCS